MNQPDDGRGILYPQHLPRFTRLPAPDDLADRVRWFWIPRWNLPPGHTSRQRLLPFPAANLVVDPAGVTLAGPTSGAAHRDLSGSGWAVGALMRPAGLAGLHPDPGAIRDGDIAVDAPDLHTAVVSAMIPDRDETDDETLESAVAAFTDWCRRRCAAPDATAVLANSLEELIAADREVVRVEQVADRLSVSIRTVQRLAKRYIGLPPLAVIRRYRLQEAVQRLRDDPSLPIARVAAELGYADHAHLAADFRTVLGIAPGAYRANER